MTKPVDLDALQAAAEAAIDSRDRRTDVGHNGPTWVHFRAVRDALDPQTVLALVAVAKAAIATIDIFPSRHGKLPMLADAVRKLRPD